MGFILCPRAGVVITAGLSGEPKEEMRIQKGGLVSEGGICCSHTLSRFGSLLALPCSTACVLFIYLMVSLLSSHSTRAPALGSTLPPPAS